MSDLPDDPQQLHERVLVLRAQLNDRAAFNELVDLYQERLTYYVQRMVQDWHQSRDILQQVWLQVFRKISTLQSPAAFRVWIYRITHSAIVTHFRRQRVDASAREEAAVEPGESDDWNDLACLENAELVHFALNKLSIVHREVMTLRFLEGLGIQEIARVMDCSEGTAKSRLHYAKGAMRQIIEKEQGHA